ncbi:magnesium transporter CorA family protein [Pseudorhodoferax sp. Leaf274]|uniref:magnesium transporter CorA family protein n=1 Tax=Pseudorhodoferax sp. Leaf274 TaxID=1736318 RepID=UPI0007036D35|nr:magnesium transporter CorA family protein [Pseudorhodoferax sp. Leaf274]KQP40760.1 magnesium transporter CorA [Pseudorhodoferax sp. Leaf274]
MQIVEFSPGTLRFAEELPERAPDHGFVWLFLEREDLDAGMQTVQRAAQRLGGSQLLDLHCADLLNAAHPSHYDYTSVYDLIVFRRLATQEESGKEGEPNGSARSMPAAFRRISTRAVGFAVFDRLLVSVHPAGCFTARAFLQRYLADAVHSDGLTTTVRNRLPTTPADLMLRMVNVMVDSYLELRKVLSQQLDHWQQELLRPGSRFSNWNALMAARNELHMLEDLCEEQHDAMQEWLDTLREQPAGTMPQAERDGLVARSRDVIEHIQRVVHHVRRLEQNAETVVQIHFSAQSNRTNDIMRILTALTAVFLPLNLIAGIFGMNFEFIPLIHQQDGFWWAMGAMGVIAVLLIVLFRRKRYLARSAR